MANDKTHLVAIDNGCYVGDIKKLNDNELNNAKNLKLQKDENKKYKEYELVKTIDNLTNRIETLEHDIKVLKGEE